MTSRVILDVWGGKNSQDLLARRVCEMPDALQAAGAELAAGFLVNMRMSETATATDEFDWRDESQWTDPAIERHVEQDEEDYGKCRH